MQTATFLNTPTATPPPPRKRKVPAYLVKEEIDGVKFYFPGYRQVVAGKKTLEEIMGWSGLQGIIVSFFTELLFKNLDLKKYRVIPGETGNHLSYRNNLSLDIAIFERAVLTANKITTKYLDVPAYCVIEIDVQAEWEDSDMSDVEFIGLKTKKLFEFGTQKLVWVLSRSKKIIVAEPDKNWQIIDWDKDIELMDGILFNVGKHLAEEGINTDIVPPIQD
ncbi:MAG: Uma2 family endonuclease [Saprospiraceae bacterium]